MTLAQTAALQGDVTIRHFTEDDIALRTELLRESRVLSNVNGDAIVRDDRAVAAGMTDTVRDQQDVKRIFTACTARGDVVGFAWITSIDWRSQTCELSFAMLPRYRRGSGVPAVVAAHRYIRAELNMKVVINQVLEHNTMLLSAEDLAATRHVRCAYDSHTSGEWRAACYWSETEQDVLASLERQAERRREIAERVRAATTSKAERSA